MANLITDNISAELLQTEQDRLLARRILRQGYIDRASAFIVLSQVLAGLDQPTAELNGIIWLSRNHEVIQNYVQYDLLSDVVGFSSLLTSIDWSSEAFWSLLTGRTPTETVKQAVMAFLGDPT